MQISQHVAQAIVAALGADAPGLDEVRRSLATPPAAAMGDVAFPCFALAKSLRAAPKAIAERIVAGLGADLAADPLIERAVAAGPFVNLYLRRLPASRLVVGQALAEGDAYGSSQAGGGATVIVEFSSPNIAKPFHFGHLRSTNIGADLARIFAFTGHRVLKRNYIGDWGTQFGFVIYAWLKWGDEAALESRAIDYLVELYVKANQEAERDGGVRDEARRLFLRLEQGDAAIRAIWERFRTLSLRGFARTYERLGVSFDSYDGEASISPRVDAVIERFVKAGVAVESQGALIVEVADVLGRDMAPCMLRKSDGASTYAARDCAEAIERYATHRFAGNFYITSRQEDHFAQVFAAIGKLAAAEGWPENWARRCENIGFGHVRGMSTRKGEAVWLEHVIDEARDRAQRVRAAKASANPRGFPEIPAEELAAISEAVGQAALLYFDVSSRRMSDVSFDWDAVLQFEGNTGPYLQYTHARMCGLFRKVGTATLARADAAALTESQEDAEWALTLKVRGFGAAVSRALAEREPNEVARYLHELASAFNTFYNRHTVLDESDAATTASRLALVRAARIALANGLRLLGIRPLEYM